MKSLVVYESFFGNTQKIAEQVSKVLGAKLVEAKKFTMDDLEGVELLIVGSPTRAFRPSPDTTKFLSELKKKSLKGIKVAAFDTRINPNEIKSPISRTFLGALTKTFGYAAKPIANSLVGKGGQLVGQPEGFYVLDSEGPLDKDELEKANQWAKSILNELK